ncbi:hypothetical protein NQ176_g10790 [Zarea fungicola]|uniref:Uncharacterized protein n=1 Tax=Zarea fungicola TaxID=93591 RepID=A0ACC1MEN2_9HYPO|nr:hypothetical protein NQ176_g10790 [Lecanicillium fungicola]
MDLRRLCTKDEAQALRDFLFGGPEKTEDEVKAFVSTLQNDQSVRTDRLAKLIRAMHLNQALDAYHAHGATIERRPGYGLLLDYDPGRDECFPRLAAADDGDDFSWQAATLLIRELCILRVIEELTNKPEWWLKVNDDEIAKKWRQEALGMDYKAILGPWAIVTPAMADAIIDELRAKAALYHKTGLIPVMDYSACAIKSDNLMPDDLVQRLKAAIAPFENVPDEAKDWHPGSDGKVLDLVHPSLWPLSVALASPSPISNQRNQQKVTAGVTNFEQPISSLMNQMSLRATSGYLARSP